MFPSSRSARSVKSTAKRKPEFPSSRSSRTSRTSSSSRSSRASCDCIDDMCQTCAMYRPTLSTKTLGSDVTRDSADSYRCPGAERPDSDEDNITSFAFARETFAFDRTLYEDSQGNTVTPSTINLPNDEIDIDFIRDVRLISPGTLKHPLRKPTLLQRFAITQRYLVKAPNQDPLPNCLIDLRNGTTFPINVERPAELKHAIADARAFVYNT